MSNLNFLYVNLTYQFCTQYFKVIIKQVLVALQYLKILLIYILWTDRFCIQLKQSYDFIHVIMSGKNYPHPNHGIALPSTCDKFEVIWKSVRYDADDFVNNSYGDDDDDDYFCGCTPSVSNKYGSIIYVFLCVIYDSVDGYDVL